MTLAFLPGYSGETLAELLALEATYRVDSLVAALEQALQQKAEAHGRECLTREESVVLAVEALEREVNNGGYDQFFLNSSAEFAPLIGEALESIGCPRTAAITRQALGALEIAELSPGAIEERMLQDDPERTSALAACDRLYHEGAEDIASRLFAYVKANQLRMDPRMPVPPTGAR